MPKSSLIKVVEDSRSFGPITVAYKKQWKKKRLKYKQEMSLIKRGVNTEPKVKSIDVALTVTQYRSQLVPQSEVDLTAFNLLQPIITRYQPAERAFAMKLQIGKSRQVRQSKAMKKLGPYKSALSVALFSEFRLLVLSRVTRDDFNLCEFDLLLKYIKKIFDVPALTKQCHPQSCVLSSPGCVR